VVKPWNSLPQEVVMAPNVKTFEARLDWFWKDQPMTFDYKEELRLQLYDLGIEDYVLCPDDDDD